MAALGGADPVVRVVFPMCNAITAGGLEVKCEFKAWLHSSEAVVWEIRRPLYTFMERKDLALHKIMAAASEELRAFFNLTGCEGHDILPSLRTLVARRQNPSPHTHEEWAIRTRALIAMLLYYALRRHRGEERCKCLGLLAGLFAALLEPADLDRGWIMAESAVVCEACNFQADGGVCVHMRCFRNEDLQAAAQLGPWIDYVWLLRKLAGWAGNCVACKKLLANWIARLALRIDTVLNDDNDSHGLQDDVSKSQAPRGAKRRLRIDEDLKKKWAHDDLQNKRSHSASQAARLQGFFASSSSGATRAWEDRHLNSYMVASWKLFDGPCIVGISSDGKRLGVPAEETNMYTAFCANKNLAVWLPPQVFVDFLPSRVDSEGNVSEEGMNKFEVRVQEFMAQHPIGQGGRKQTLSGAKKQLLTNEERVKGLDHAIQLGLGWGLDKLRPSFRPKPTDVDEERFYVDTASLPEEVRSNQPDRDRRSCIEKKGRNADSRLEVIYDDHRYLVVNWLDQGSAEWPSRLWLNYGLRLRFQEFLDVFHRRDNNVKLAFSRAGLNSIKVEMAVCLNGLQGPWTDAGNFGKVAACAEQYFRNNSYRCPIFRTVYDWIVLDRNKGERPHGFGSDSHMEMVWNELAECPVLVKKLDQVKMGRWLNFVLKMWRISEYGSSLLLLLVVLGMQEGWYKTVYESALGGGSFRPLSDAGAEEARPAAASASSSGAAPRANPPQQAASSAEAPRSEGATVKAAKKEFDRKRDKYKNTLHMMSYSLANRMNIKVAKVMMKVAMPIALEHSRSVEEFHTQAGILLWHADMAFGEYANGDMQDIVAVLEDPAALTEIGFSEPGSIARSHDLGKAEEHLLAETLLDLVRHMYGIEYMPMMMYTDRFPQKFACLVHPDSRTRERALSEAGDLRDVLENAELAARTSPFLKNYLDSLLWPKSTWVRETLVGLDESGWSRVPADIWEQVVGVFTSQGSTLLNENIFDHLTSEARQSKQAGLGRSTRWHRAISSNLLEEYDRKQPVIDIEAKAAASKLNINNKFYEARSCNFSLGEDLERLGTRQDLPPISIAAYNMIPMATSAMAMCVENFDRLRTNWLSLLASPGFILWHEEVQQPEQDMRYVITTSEHGVLYFTGHSYHMHGKHFISLRDAATGKAVCKHGCITSLAGWKVLRTAAVAPAEYNDEGAMKVRIEIISESEGLLEAAARKAFAQMNGTHLKDLIAMIGVESEGPQTTIVHDMVRLLVRHTFPDMPADEVEAIITRRLTKAQNTGRFQTNLADNAEIALEAIHEDDYAEAEAEITEMKKEMARRTNPNSVVPKARPPVKQKKIGIFEGDRYTSEQLSPFLPKVEGCRVYVQVDEWHHRITVYYPRDLPPFSCSKSFAKGGSQKFAAATCIHWAWAQHRAAIGAQCPWDLDEALTAPSGSK